jgi:DegV family protein with EDD domain
MHIVTDSAADLTPEEIHTHNIHIAPLKIQFPEGEISSEAISRNDFYARLAQLWPRIPTTSLPSPGDFAAIYHKLAEIGGPVLSLHISSGLSATLESARQGAQSASTALVEHIDTLTLSGGQRFQVLTAALAARAGWTVQAIRAQLEKVRQASEVVYTLETLAYLQKGGRIGRVQALASALLNIKPLIKVDKSDGKYSTLGKERTISRALQAIRNHLQRTYGDTRLHVSVLHGQAAAQAEELAGLLSQGLNLARLEVLRISPVLGVHTGPGVIGAAVVPAHLMEEIG